ncbi:MAG: retron system putative HNH endonuclease [Segetibacter sp.]
MKQIQKNKALNTLAEHAKKDHSDYDNYPDKDNLREALYNEQRGICCYCMGVIFREVKYMKIEHFKSQEFYPQYQLKYWNLLGACKGNEGQPLEAEHCDTFKKSKDLSFYPPEPSYAVEDLIFYGNDGTIGSTNTELNTEIEEVLNLNVKILKSRRKAALDGFKEGLKKHKGLIPKSTLSRWLKEWDGTSNSDSLKPYCMVITYWIKKKI